LRIDGEAGSKALYEMRLRTSAGISFHEKTGNGTSYKETKGRGGTMEARIIEEARAFANDEKNR